MDALRHVQYEQYLVCLFFWVGQNERRRNGNTNAAYLYSSERGSCGISLFSMYDTRVFPYDEVQRRDLCHGYVRVKKHSICLVQELAFLFFFESGRIFRFCAFIFLSLLFHVYFEGILFFFIDFLLLPLLFWRRLMDECCLPLGETERGWGNADRTMFLSLNAM